MPARLYCFELSHPSQMVRIALRMKGVPFEERHLPAGLHPALLRLSGFSRGTVPGLKLEDGRRLQSSREITRVLDELVPGDPVLHPSPEVTEAERWAEAELQMSPRRMFRLGGRAPARHRAESGQRPEQVAGTAPGRQAGMADRAGADNSVGADDEAVQRELQLLPDRLDRVDGMLASGLIGGDTLNAADLQIGCSVHVFLAFPQVAPYLAGRPCEAHARRVLPDTPEPVPLRLPEAWLPA